MHQRNTSRKKLGAAIIINMIITVGELAGGLLANSLALISNALLTLSEGIILVLHYLSGRQENIENDQKKRSADRRAEILTVIFNAAILLAVAFFLIVKSVDRFLHPAQNDALLMLFVASIGLILNLSSAFLTYKDEKAVYGFDSSYTTILADTAASLMLLAGSALIYFFDFLWVDPVLSLLLTMFLLKRCFNIISESISLIVDSKWESIDSSAIKRKLESLEPIRNVHHISVQRIKPNELQLSAHLILSDDISLIRIETLQREAAEIIKKEYPITRFALQVEFQLCTNDKK